MPTSRSMAASAASFLSTTLGVIYGTLLALVLSVRANLEGYIFCPPSPRLFELIAKYRNQYWNLSTSIQLTETQVLSHGFVCLQSGLTLHYLSSSLEQQGSSNSEGDLVIFLHGWPDSAMLWLKVISKLALRTSTATFVALDMPGFGASGNLPDYGPNSVLDSVVEFIHRMRGKFLGTGRKVILVSHDWGAAVAGRLAVEAPSVANHFILINGPIMAFLQDSVARQVQMCFRSFSSFDVRVAWLHLEPVVSQVVKSFYIFVFNLPGPLGQYLLPFALRSGRHFFVRAVSRIAVTGKPLGVLPKLYKRDDRELEEKMAFHLASALGPAADALTSSLDSGINSKQAITRQYTQDTVERVKSREGWGNVETQCLGYYRDGLASRKWRMSDHVRKMCKDMDAQERSEAAGTADKLKTPVTIVWGHGDPALDFRLMVEGVEKWSNGMVNVRWVERAGHWVVCQENSKGPNVVVEELLRALRA